MKRFIEGEERSQVTLLPECLDDYIAEDNPIRVVDVFVEGLHLHKLGFEGTKPAATGRPSSNVGHDRDQLANMAQLARDATGERKLIALADRGYFEGYELLKCERAGIAALVPKPMTSNSTAEGRFDKRDFVYDEHRDEYRCPAGQIAIRRFTSVEHGKTLHKYWTSACPSCPIKGQCTTSDCRRITRWEHEAVLDIVQARLDGAPEAPRLRRQTVEHVFGTLKAWMGSTHFLTKTLPRVRTEMSLQVLAYNLKRAIKILGAQNLMLAMQR